MRERSAGTTFEGGCQSWYVTADGVNTNNWTGTMREYRMRTATPDLAAYRFETGADKPKRRAA